MAEHAGDPVLFIHSTGFTSRQWRKLAALVAPTHPVVAPDLIGYGASAPWPTGKPFHFREDVSWLASHIDGATPTPIRVHLVGHSDGGLLALQLALAHPGWIRSISVYEPVSFGVLDERTDAEARRILDRVRRPFDATREGADEAWLADFVDWWNGPGAWAALPEPTKASFRSVGWKASEEVRTLSSDTTSLGTYATIAAPTLLLGGSETPMPERRVVEKLASALPNAALRIFEGAGHMGPITHAEAVNQAIADHIGSTERGGTLRSKRGDSS